jgi:hypothetical protein
MPRKDPRVDAYIKKSAPFAQPILKHLRAVVHEAVPDAEETLRWRMPAFTHHGLLLMMASFKNHCGLWFWKRSLVFAAIGRNEQEALGRFGRLTKLSDLPPRRALLGYVKKAAALNEAGVPKRVGSRSPKARAAAAGKRAATKKPMGRKAGKKKTVKKPATKSATKRASRSA